VDSRLLSPPVRMRLFIQLRSILSTLLAVLLIAALASGECTACGTAGAASAQSGDCCNPNGHCKASPHQHSTRCVKEQSIDFVVVDQLGQVAPVLPPDDFGTPSSRESAPNAAIPFVFHDFSPPEHHILNSALLI
jgi:hypothetical protein